MPRNEWDLTPEEVEKARKTIFEKWVDPKCPICKSADLTVGDTITTAIVVDPKKPALRIFGATVMIPQVIVACNNCGHILSFSAQSVGVEFKKQEEGKND